MAPVTITLNERPLYDLEWLEDCYKKVKFPNPKCEEFLVEVLMPLTVLGLNFVCLIYLRRLRSMLCWVRRFLASWTIKSNNRPCFSCWEKTMFGFTSHITSITQVTFSLYINFFIFGAKMTIFSQPYWTIFVPSWKSSTMTKWKLWSSNSWTTLWKI